MTAPGNDTFYITTPIYYVNDRPHIGHAYCTIAADVLARYHRLRGEQVLFVTGTDEHGQKIARAAAARGLAPQAFVDEIVQHFQVMWQRLNIDYDRFIRTTEPEHIHAVQTVFEQLKAQGDIYLGEYQGWYCVPCETHFPESELKDGNCPDCNRPAEQTAQKAYFLRTSRYAQRLLDHIEANPDFIMPESRRNEVIAFIAGGLRDGCVSRARSEWDIPVLSDNEQSVYVWFDALVNYLTAVGYPDDREKMATWWPPQVQLVGKDILTRFHATLWPAMLMGLDLPLPETVFGHGWWMSVSGERFAKSKGGAVDPWVEIERLVEISGCTQSIAVDAMRYFVLREVTFGLDGSYSTEALLQRFNADLANDLGNLLNRTLPLVERFLSAQVPEASPPTDGPAAQIGAVGAAVEHSLARFDFRSALEAIWSLIAAGNKFIDERQPWTLNREGRRDELASVLYNVLDCLRAVSIMIQPVMPLVAEEIWRRLGLGSQPMSWSDLAPGLLPAGLTVDKGEPLFPRVDIEAARKELSPTPEETTAPDAAVAAAPAIPTVSFAQFQQLDLRVGRVLSVEPVAGANKLLLLTVDVGEDAPRQIVAGLAERFGADDLVGNSVVVVANLEPATIRGVQSNGMILAAGGKVPIALVVLAGDCAPGEKVR